MAWRGGGLFLERGPRKQKEGVQDGHRTPPRDLNPTFPIRRGGDRAKTTARLVP